MKKNKEGNQIIQWLKKNHYDCKTTGWMKNGKTYDAILVKNEYVGLYPTEEVFKKLNIVKSYVAKYHPNYTVEQVGFYTGILILPKS